MLQIILLEALFINWLLMIPAYSNLVKLLKLPSKPFLCQFCLTFWLNIILSIVTLNPVYLILAVTAPVATVGIKRALDALPISF